MNTGEVLSKLDGVSKTGPGWQAKCPAHDDKDPSLSIKEGSDGRTLIHCHAGCTPDAVIGAIGLTRADLFTTKPTKPERNGKSREVAAYPYTDEQGKVLFEVVRFEPKDFRQRAPDGTWSTKGIRRVPFHLPQLLEAVQSKRTVYIVEGEKDVLALEAAGFAATCNPAGAGKWQADFAPHFKGAEVVIIADKDGPGRKHAEDVWGKLSGTAASIKVIELPDLTGKPVKDAADYFAAGGQAADLNEIVRTAESGVQPKADPWLELVEDGAELQTRELPQIVEIVEDIVAEFSKLSIVSSAKCFKTWTTIYAGLAIAHGIEFLGKCTTRRRVLYVNLELKPQTFTRRLQAIANALCITIDPKWFSHLSLRGRLGEQMVAGIVTRIIKVAKEIDATVVIVDPLFKLNIEGEENSSRDQTVFCNQLDRLTTEGPFTAIFNDHSGKGNQSEKDPLDVIRGSSAKGGDLDAAMVLRKHDVDGCFRVDLVHRELAPVAAFVVGWEFPLMRIRKDLNPDEMKKAKGGQSKHHDPKRLCTLIEGSTDENPVTVSAWAKAAGIPRTTLAGYLPGLRTKGWIATAGEGNGAGQYLTPEGLKAVAKCKEVA